MISLRSQLRRNLLTFFYVNRTARAYVRELAVALGADSTNVSRELAHLEREGLLQSQAEGRQLYYSLNRDYTYLRPLFTMLQGTIGIQPTVTHALRSVAGVESAWLYGSFAKNQADAASDVDVLVIGAPDQTQLAATIRQAEQTIRREINYTVLTSRELQRRLAANDVFIADIWNGKRIELIRDEKHKASTDPADPGPSVPRRRSKESRRRP